MLACADSPVLNVEILQIAVLDSGAIYVKTSNDQQAFDDGCSYSFGSSVGRYRVPSNHPEKDKLYSLLLAVRTTGATVKRIYYTVNGSGYCDINTIWY